MSLPFTASKKKRSDRMETDNDEEAAGREPQAESQMKKRKTNEEYIRKTNSIINQYQRRIDWYESRIQEDPELEQVYRRVINREKASVQRLQDDAMTLHFEML